MADFYIITPKKYVQHKSLGVAERERDRLARGNPGVEFRIYRCKFHLQPDGAFEDVIAFVRQRAVEGDTEAQAAIARLEARDPSTEQAA